MAFEQLPSGSSKWIYFPDFPSSNLQVILFFSSMAMVSSNESTINPIDTDPEPGFFLFVGCNPIVIPLDSTIA
jgi:hypothetical protein